ncbi:MAG: chromosomal replication initiator protein DnaA [Patescibacteria group bacterium]
MTAINAYWNFVQEDLKLKLSLSQYQAWLSHVNFVKTTNLGRNAILEVPSKFNKERIEKKYKQDLLCSMNKYYPKVDHIEFVIREEALKDDAFIDAIITSQSKSDDGQTEGKIVSTNDVLESKPVKTFTKNGKKTAYQDSTEDLISNSGVQLLDNQEQVKNNYSVLPKQNIHNLNNRFTFESLVVANYNELAISVAKAIIRQPGKLYNPVFIHSATGLGKTHLLQAIGHKILEAYPSFNIRYTSSETFLNHYTACMQKGKGNEFHEYYRSVDLLMIDDIQFLTSKVSTQEVLFHTFNELHQQNKQIIVTSDRSPKQLSGFQDRLISRFEWGMVLDLGQPSFEDRVAIVKQKVAELNLNMSDEHVLLIAESIQTNIRDIEGVVNQIQARIAFRPNVVIDSMFLNKVLSPFAGIINQGMMQFSYNPEGTNLNKSASTNSRELNLPEIYTKAMQNDVNLKSVKLNYNKLYEAIATNMRVSKDELNSKMRDKQTALARQIAMYVLSKKYRLSSTKIGQLIAKRKHSTVIHAVQKIETVITTNQAIRDLVNIILING